MRSKVFHTGRLGVCFYARSTWQHREFLTPCISVSSLNDKDAYVDVELRALCFGVGFRIIFLKDLRK